MGALVFKMSRENQRSRLPANLLVLNYSMDPDNQVFSHQLEVVRKLSPHFNEIRVVTADKNISSDFPNNVRVYTSNWRVWSNLTNVLSFYKTFYNATKNFENYVIFSHMTEVQSVLAAPLTFYQNTPHFLWYAHKSKSLYLRLNHSLLNGIITSTPGSCPIESEKVRVIGQGIDENLFVFRKNNKLRRDCKLNLVHVGRLDPSKGIQNIINETLNSSWLNHFEKLLFIGAPTPTQLDYQVELEKANSHLISLRKLFFLGPIARHSLPSILKSCDLFVHSFNGSLDKSLVEATMLGMPVVTCNAEYQKIFGTWTQSSTNVTFELSQELDSFMQLRESNPETLVYEISRRRNIALNQHSLENWITELLKILKGSQK
jgi:glycosyltransferase involved in cell wall biosynthesis